MNSAPEYAAAIRPELADTPGRSFALDALLFFVLATGVALAVAAVLSAVVLLLAGRAEATPAASAVLSPPAAAQAAAVCAAGEIASLLLPVGDPHTSRPPLPVEHCHFTMKFSHVPQGRPESTLLQVRRADAYRKGSA